MVTLPEEFAVETRHLLGEERFERYMKAFEDEPPVSIRLNPRKLDGGAWSVADGERVPWCSQGYYLPRRPNFTMDPLLHAGCYYVQEASSMFLEQVMRQIVNSKLSNCKCLDLCAAPGGKSTLLRSVLPDTCRLISNEPNPKRFQVLAENVAKWGYANHEVTNLYPRDFVRQKQHFDLILCDVPCSGEGMFRKDAATISEWSPKNVERCWQLQREIVSDAWRCLNDGGILIYSTCTFNTKENEENVRWFTEELGAKLLPIETRPEWGITGSLLEGFTEPVYRFIPGITRGEGLFMAILQNGPTEGPKRSHGGTKTVPRRDQNVPTEGPNAQVELPYQQAIAYLRGEALVLPEETPRGIVEVTFLGHTLGQMKNIGSRANNLYPKAWRIKTTHIPNEYEAILRHS
ncbi:MAG: hypothetical protein J6I31_09270 [Prevotella sp.]|nr:hypothetical protein [Prevotella sp.]